MSIIFSRQCEYALQAVLYLALQPRGTMTSIKDLTSRLGVPYHFLGKILQRLSRKGLLTSQKGSTGGFALAHIVESIDGVDFTKQCVLGFPECSGKNPCAVHHQWGEVRENIYQMLVRKNIGEMAKETKKPEFRVR
jgi:Rrf2 family protein